MALFIFQEQKQLGADITLTLHVFLKWVVSQLTIPVLSLGEKSGKRRGPLIQLAGTGNALLCMSGFRGFTQCSMCQKLSEEVIIVM